jgi:eukaryotic-like serine/threonine-protein kinase
MVGRLIDGRYQVRSRIARGGMATVYLATDLRLERRVAIKVMHGHLADDIQFKSRFVQEARSAARLAHPNVVNVFDQGQDSDMAYLVMEYLPGITLRDLLKDYGKLTPEQTIDIMEAVLSGLAAAHKAGIVHRDLKPENVLLADDGRIKIGDFGLARAASANTGTGQALLGTIAYLSPELVTRGVADARSDIYALGIMMYEMLTGEQPFTGEQPLQIAYQHANDSVPLPSAKNAAVPPELDELVLWATEKDPDHRPHDAQEMLERLIDAEKALRGEFVGTTVQPTMVMPPAYDPTISMADTQVLGSPVVHQQVTPVGPATVNRLATLSSRRRARGWWLFIAVLLVAALAGGTGWYFGSGPGSMVTIPNVVSQSPQAASAALTKLGFKVAQGAEYSLTIDKGLVSSTTPAVGTSAHNGSTVTVRVSEGPMPISLPALAGLPQQQAEDTIKAKTAVVGTIAQQFSSDVQAGTVISAAGASGNDLSKGGSYFQGQKVNLVVSVGAIPDVAGKSVADATSALEAKGLKVQQGEQTYSDTVANGAVITAVPTASGPVSPGDTMSLTISKGPQPVAVPNVSGMTITAAEAAIKTAGLVASVNSNVPQPLWGVIEVVSISPASGTMVAPGSTVTIQANY